MSLLKKAVGSQEVSPSIPPSLSSDIELLVQPAVVLGVHPSMVPSTVYREVLIRWLNLPAYEDSWESFNVIQPQFPHFNLEDKVNTLVAGNNKPQIQVTYARRNRKSKSAATGDI